MNILNHFIKSKNKKTKVDKDTHSHDFVDPLMPFIPSLPVRNPTPPKAPITPPKLTIMPVQKPIVKQPVYNIPPRLRK